MRTKNFLAASGLVALSAAIPAYAQMNKPAVMADEKAIIVGGSAVYSSKNIVEITLCTVPGHSTATNRASQSAGAACQPRAR